MMTITAAMTANKPEELTEGSEATTTDLWSVMNIYGCNHWFLGVDQAVEVTESFTEKDGRSEGETFEAKVKVRASREDFILMGENELLRTVSNGDVSLHRWSR